MKGLGLLLSALAAIITNVECYCYSTLYANTYFNTKSVSTSAQGVCTINIRPSSYFYSSYYYLEITWSSSNFDVKGYMPFCKDDYVEVFLTRYDTITSFYNFTGALYHSIEALKKDKRFLCEGNIGE